jgi:tetratricopeptide (TPR) repeat protein
MEPGHEQITRYQLAIDRLENPTEPDLPGAALLALLSRDTIDRSLKSENDVASPAAIAQLAENDRRLRALAPTIDESIGSDTISAWRKTMGADEGAWWWSLDELAAAKQRQQVWTVISVLLLTIAAYFIVDTFNRLRSVGENPVGTGGALVQVVLGLIAASAFTGAGRQRFVDLLGRLGKKRRQFKGFGRMVLTALILGATLLIWSYLPAGVAWYFRREGDRFQTEGLVQRAIHAYQQASVLQPYSIPTHLALAKAAERANDYDKAIAEYKTTAVLYERTRKPDDSYYEARNNLARLLIQHEKNYSQALRILNKPEEMISGVSPQNRRLYTYFFWTSRGWANLELKSYAQADGELRAALQQRSNGAAAHYLLARVWEAQDEKNKDKAREKLSQFLTILQQDPKQTDEVLPTWISYAQERLLARRP